MRIQFRVRFGGLMISMALMLVGCTKGAHGGDPALPLSTTNGTTVVFLAPEVTVLAAISTAFGGSSPDPRDPLPYRGMMLCDATNYSMPNWQQSNGFALTQVEGPITYVPLTGGKPKSVSYHALFNITTKSLGNTNTAVTVRTFNSKVLDGKERDILGGWINYYREVPPVKAEEENVLNAISNAFIKLHARGETNR